MSDFDMSSAEVQAATQAMHNTTPDQITSVILMVIALTGFCLALAIVFSLYRGFKAQKLSSSDFLCGAGCAFVVLVCVGCLI